MKFVTNMVTHTGFIIIVIIITVGPLYNGHFGTRRTVCYTEVSTIERLFYMCNNLRGPTKVVCYRGGSAIKGVSYKRFYCTR